MQTYHKSAHAGNISHNPLSITFAGTEPPEAKPGRATRTGFTMITCRACGSTWRVPAATDLWEFRYRHASECLDLLDRIALHLARIGSTRYVARRVGIIGSTILAEPVIHRQRKGRELTACDHRCQRATGPDCDCVCQGSGHGVAHAR